MSLIRLPALDADCHELTVKREILKRKACEPAASLKPAASCFLDLHGGQARPDKMPQKPSLEKRDSFALRKNSTDTHSTILSVVNDTKRIKQI